MDIFRRGSGDVARDDRSLPPFDGVRLDGVGRVRVVLGDDHRVVVEAPEDLLDRIETVVEDGLLVLRLARGCCHIPRGADIRFAVTTRSLRELDIDGSGSIDAPSLSADSVQASIDGVGRIAVEGIEARHLRAAIDGAGRLVIGRAKAEEARFAIDGSGVLGVQALESKTVRVSIDGMGRVTASGVTQTLTIGVDGTGDVDARDLDSHAVEVDIDGVGKVSARANRTLDVHVDGFGRIEYAGNPVIRRRSDGTCCLVRTTEPKQSAGGPREDT